MAPRRVTPKRKSGLFNKRAPFWRGERAEDIVRRRVEVYASEAREKRRKRRRRRSRE